MRSTPSWLPAADSDKWHNRRWWDQLGYVRVRSLANPSWPRDVDWLIGVMEHSRPGEPGPQRDALDRAIRAAKAYRSLQRRAREQEASWDAFLDMLDDYLRLVQQQHLGDIVQTGTSDY